MSFLTYPKDDRIHRIEYKADGFVNVTEMAKIFGKDQFDFFRHKTAVEYIQALSRSTGIQETELKYTVKGNFSKGKVNRELPDHSEQGTFCHPKLAIRFAQWLNADFAVWVDGKILDILNPQPKEESFEQKTLTVLQGLLGKVEEQKLQIDELTPKAEFADHVAMSEKFYSFREACKLLAVNIGEKRLFAYCREKGIIMPSNEPYQDYMESGYFKLCIEKFEKPNGQEKIYKKTVITGKGLDFLDKRLRKDGYYGVVA